MLYFEILSVLILVITMQITKILNKTLTFTNEAVYFNRNILNQFKPYFSEKPKNGALKITPAIFKSGFFNRNVFITIQPILFPYRNVGRPSVNSFIIAVTLK